MPWSISKGNTIYLLLNLYMLAKRVTADFYLNQIKGSCKMYKIYDIKLIVLYVH